MTTLRASGLGPVAIAGLLAACVGGAPSDATRPGTSAASLTPVSSERPANPTPAPEPTSPFADVDPTTDLPAGWRITRTAEVGLGLVTDEVLMATNLDTRTVYRYDRATFEDLGEVVVGELEDFPPDGQSIALGRDGVWVTLASQQAVELMDPVTGNVLRHLSLEGFPYDAVEHRGDLWIADYELSKVYRWDLERDKVVGEISVTRPTDIIVGGGALWAPVHVGRAGRAEPIEGNGAEIVRIDPGTNSVVKVIPVGPRPYYMAFGFGGVWTGTATGEAVWRVDVATNAPTRIPVLEDGVFDIEVVGDSVWAIPGWQWPIDRGCDPKRSWFIRIDPETNEVSERVAFPCATSITPDREGFWVSGGNSDAPYSAFYEPTA